MISAEIISTGSKGNAIILNQWLQIDCGVPFSKLEKVYRNLSLVLLTHIHSDHFRKSTLATLARERPTLRFGCGAWLAPELVRLVPPQNIDVLEPGRAYNYGKVTIEPVRLWHDVPNCGYKMRFASGERAFYATDTGTLKSITAPGYDLYLVEANHDEDEIREKIRDHKAKGEFSYERRAAETHLSRQQAEAWLAENIGSKSEYIFLHGHQDD